MKRLMFGMAVATAVSLTHAADLTIGVGESETLAGTQTFDRIFCNGALSIADDAEISCTSFCMASGVVANVSVTLGNNAKLLMPQGGGGVCLIGCDGGAGSLTLGTNALFRTTKKASVQYTTPQGNAFFTAENPFPTTAKIFIHLMDGASIDGQVMESTLTFGDGTKLAYGSYGRFEGITVQLDRDANLNYCSFQQRSRPNCRILFNGGYLRQQYWNNSCTATLFSGINWYEDKVAGAQWYLTGTNQHDIIIQRDAYANAVFHLSSGGSRFTLDGDGGFVIRGTAGRNTLADIADVSRLVDEPHAPTKDWIAMKFPGRIALEDRIWVRLAAWGTGARDPGAPRSDFFPDGSTLVIGPNAGIDLYGADITNATIMAEGSLVNGSTNVSTLVMGGDADGRLETLGTNIVVRKSGTGCLTLGTNCVDVASVKVAAGSLAIDGRDAENSAARIRDLTLGAGVVCTTTVSAVGRTVAVKNLTLDAMATVALDRFAPEADGTLDLLNGEYTLSPTPVALPFTATRIVARQNLRGWTLLFDGEVQGAVGAAAPAISWHNGSLTLGRWGMLWLLR